MVRIKHRYLLVNILYPDLPSQPPPPPPPSSKPQTTATATAAPERTDTSLLPSVVQFHQPTPDDITPQILARVIKDQIALLYGDYGVGVTAASLNVKYLSPATSTAIIRCSRTNYRLVWAALSFMTHLPPTSTTNYSSSKPRPCVFRVVRVSGTIKKVEEEAIKRAKADVLRAQRERVEVAAAGLDAILG